MKWTDISKDDEGKITIPDNWLFIYHYEALNVLFRIENALRVFVYIVLKNKHAKEWTNLNISLEDGKQITIESVAKKRQTQERTFGYIGHTFNCPIMYLSLGELMRLITSDSYWKYFKKFFPAGRDILKTKFEEMNSIRKSFAHFRTIKKDDIELGKQNALHILTGVEECISHVYNCNNIVPSNCKDKWYRDLMSINSDSLNIRLSQSRDEKWIELELEYRPPIIKQYAYRKDIRNYKILKLNSPNTLNLYKNLRNYVICVFEYTPTYFWDKDPDFFKLISFVFNRDTIKKHITSIKGDIMKLVRKIEKETSLIQEDNLATGDIIESVDARVIREKDCWKMDTNILRYPVSENDPPEFWGQKIISTSNCISDIERYPWMPKRISAIIF